MIMQYWSLYIRHKNFGRFFNPIIVIPPTSTKLDDFMIAPRLFTCDAMHMAHIAQFQATGH